MSNPQQPHHSASDGSGESYASGNDAVPLQRPGFNIFSRANTEKPKVDTTQIPKLQPVVGNTQPIPEPAQAGFKKQEEPANEEKVHSHTVQMVAGSAPQTLTPPAVRAAQPKPQNQPSAAPTSEKAEISLPLSGAISPQASPATTVVETQPRLQPTPRESPSPSVESLEPETMSRVTVSRTGPIPSRFSMSDPGDSKTSDKVEMPWQKIPDALPIGLIVFDAQQEVIYVNPAHRALLNISVEDFSGIEAWLQETCPNVEYARRVLDSWREHVWRKQLTRTFSLRGADKKLREIEFCAKLLDDGGLLLTQLDVTERRRNESQLRLGEKKFRTVFQNDPGGLVMVDPGGGILDANPAFEHFVQKTVNELRRMKLTECLVPQDGLRLRAAEEKIPAESTSGRENQTIEVRFLQEGQQSVDLPMSKLTLCPIRDDEGRARMGLYFLKLPTPENEQAENKAQEAGKAVADYEQRLRRSHEQNRALMNAVSDLIVLVDRQFQIIDVAPPTGSWCGNKPLPSWRGKRAENVWPEFGDVLMAHSEETNSDNVATGEFESGRGLFQFAIAECGEDQLLITVTDITESDSPREETRWHEAAIAEIDEPVLVADLRGIICHVNPACETAFGFSQKELIGKGIAKLYSRDETAARDFNAKLSESLNQHGRWEGSCEFYRKDGTRGVAELKLTPVPGKDGPKELIAVHREATKNEHHELPETPKRESAGDVLEHEQMQHRFRNQLQMVTSLFALEQERGEAEAEADKLDAGNRWQVRLRAMAQAHAHQHPQDETVWIVPLIRSISDEVAAVTGRGPGRREVIVHGSDSFRIDAEMATAFSLMIGEIIRLSMKRPVRSDGPELFIQLTRKSKTELAVSATPGAGGALFPESKDASLNSLKNLVQQLRGRMQLTQNGGTQALSVIISSGVKLRDEA